MNREYACRMIYREAFNDPDTSYENALFENCYRYCKTLELDGEVVSMLFALPCSIDFSHKKADAIYLYAAATDEKFRGNGYMSELIEKLKSDTDSIIFLRPATKELVGFYEKFGFKSIKTSNESKNGPLVIPEAGYRVLVSNTCENTKKTDENMENFTVMYYSKDEKEEICELYFVDSME